MKITFSRSEKMLFALLRVSLKGKPVQLSVFTGASTQEWQQCYKLASRQGVMALAWDGILFLPAEWQPPRDLKLVWGIAVEQYEKRYRRYSHTVYELSVFYAAHGITTVQLKGVGMSSYYPVPAHREGGDIDIFTYSADRNRMNDIDANRLADELMEMQGIEVDRAHSEKHSMFFYKGIPIENHKTFLNVERYRMAVRIENILKEILCPQMVKLLDGEYRVQIPSPAFNTLFIAFHAIQHYGCGLTLHQLCDWACLLNRYGLHLSPEITDKRFLQAVAALTQITNGLLGTDIAIDGSEKLAEKMIYEILHSPYAEEVPAMNKARILAFKAGRLLHLLHNRKDVLDESVFMGVVRSAVAHIREPRTIFKL